MNEGCTRGATTGQPGELRLTHARFPRFFYEGKIAEGCGAGRKVDVSPADLCPVREKFQVFLGHAALV